MTIILLLHILSEGIIGLLFLFYPNAASLVPGFEDGGGDSHDLLMNMYGLAALFLAAVGVAAYRLRTDNVVLTYTIMAWLAVFHFAMSGVQLWGNPDQRAGLFHLLMGLFLAGLYIRRPGGVLKKA